ncbi:MAG: gamma-glutamyltransferase family protein [Ardenticatenaceae bacterium]
MNLLALPYPSQRMPAVARGGMVATTQPLAVRAGLAMLEAGGNAVDAAIAAAVTLTVVEPTSNGIGGDAFALVWDGERLHGLNGSGRSPAALTLDLVRSRGHEATPARGWLSVTVPGQPRAWHDLHARFGRLCFEQLFEPAIQAADEGYALTPIVAYNWARAARAYAEFEGAEFAQWSETFTIGGRAPEPGQVWRSPEIVQTLRRIAESGSDDFYSGQLAERIARFAARTEGILTASDLAAHQSEWVEPIFARYRGYEVWELPPNGQGLAALLALNLLEGFDLAALPRESVEAYHLQIEAMKVAFADAHQYICDPAHAHVPTEGLLSKAYAASRRALIGERARIHPSGEPERGGTVYLCTADQDGMMVSYIQSNYMGFGSGIVVPGTGIALQNRGAGFRLDLDHPNALAPGKRPFHTIIPAFLTRGGEPVGPFGVMGAHMQPQGHVQMVLNTVDWRLNPQASLDAPRWRYTEGRGVLLEHGTPRHVVQGLHDRGHDITLAPTAAPFGRGQIIWRTQHGTYVAGSEPRADGLAMGI